MKNRNCLFPVLVAVVMLTSCQKDGAQTTVESGATKSVTVTIANVAPPATRVPQTGFSVGEIPVAALTELKVLFADNNGAVVDTRSLTSTTGTDVDTDIIDPDGTGTSYTYTFHQVPDTATKLAVSNVTVTDLDDLNSTLNGYNVSSYQAIPSTSTSIPAWGFNSTWATADTDADGFPHINAGIVEVEPKLARIEIGGIRCLNLGTATANATTGLYPRFGTLTLANIGIHGTRLGTISGNVTTYGPDAAGLAAWNTAVTGPDPVGWNIDPVGGNVLNSTTALAGKFFGFNVVPGAAPNIILEISSATENANTNLPAGGIPGSVDPDEHYFVKSKTLNDSDGERIETFHAGYIYQVNFQFNTENVELWSGEDEFICVDVAVIIPDWVIVNAITPGFVDPE